MGTSATVNTLLRLHQVAELCSCLVNVVVSAAVLRWAAGRWREWTSSMCLLLPVPTRNRLPNYCSPALQMGRTPLHLACEKGHVAAAAALVAGGADLLAKDKVRRSAKASRQHAQHIVLLLACVAVHQLCDCHMPAG
jgi:hypothetical protein